MPLQKLVFKPGVNRDQTNYSNEGGWNSCDKIRFRSGYPQKLGGWIRYGGSTILGVCRQLFAWNTTFQDNFLAIGTDRKAYLDLSTTLWDITPVRETFTHDTVHSTDDCIAVTSGSNVVTVTIVGNGSNTGAFVTLSDVVGTGDPQLIGGIPVSEINGEHEITVIDEDTFTFTVTTAATSTDASAGGTNIVAAFQINPGFPITQYGYGWNAGAWGRNGWGAGSTLPIKYQQRDWWFDQFDNDLVLNIRDGGLYYWERGANDDPDLAVNTRAVLLSSLAGAADVPTTVMQALVSQNDKHLIAFGATPFGGGDFDPLLIRWATQDNPRIWTPLVTNSAGFLRVSRGARIIRAIPTRQEIVVFTESGINSLQFLGTSDVYNLQEMADNISIASPRACAVANNTVYWMGKDKFYAYSGRVETLPCTLRNHVFNNINFMQADQIICGTNEGWNEIWWFYPTANSNYNDAYVVYNHLERIWYYGSIERTAWLDSPIREYPQAVKTASDFITGALYDHENGTNDGVIAMDSYIQSSDFDIQDGDQFTLIKRVIPDIDFSGSTAALPEVSFTMRPRNFPGNAYETEAPGRVIETSVDVYTEQVFIRARARQMAIKVSSADLDTQWQLGAPRLDGRPDGHR